MCLEHREMAVHIFTLILLLMVETCFANVETIEFDLGGRKIRIPLNKPTLVELNKDGNLKDIHVDMPELEEINKHLQDSQISPSPPHHLLQPDHRIPIQRTSEEYHHPSQSNIYKYFPPTNNAFTQPHQRQPISQYPEAQFPGYPHEDLNQHYHPQHMHPAQYPKQIQTPRYSNDYRNPYLPPAFDTHSVPHVQNLRHAPSYYPNYGYPDPYYGNGYHSHPQENYAPNAYINKNTDYIRNNPNIYNQPSLSYAEKFNGQHSEVHSEIPPNRLPIVSTNTNVPPVPPGKQNHNNALKSSQSTSKPLPRKPSPIPRKTPSHTQKGAPPHARTKPVNNVMALNPNPKHEYAPRPLQRMPENVMNARDLMRDGVPLQYMPVSLKEYSIPIPKSIKETSQNIPVSPVALTNLHSTSSVSEIALPSLIVEDKKHTKKLHPIITTTSTTTQPDLNRESTENIMRNIKNSSESSVAVKYISIDAPPLNAKEQILEQTFDGKRVKSYPVQNETDNSKAQSAKAQESVPNTTTYLPVQDTTTDIPATLMPVQEIITNAPNKSPDMQFMTTEALTTKKLPENDKTDLSEQHSKTKTVEVTTNAPKLAPNDNKQATTTALVEDTTIIIPPVNKPENSSEKYSGNQKNTYSDSQYTTTENNAPLQHENTEQLTLYKEIASPVPDRSSLGEVTTGIPESSPTTPYITTDVFDPNATSEPLVQDTTITNLPDIQKNSDDQNSNDQGNKNAKTDISSTLLTTQSSAMNNADNTNTEIPQKQNATISEILMQSASTETQTSTQLVQNSTITATKDASTTTRRKRRRPCKKHHRKRSGGRKGSGHRRRRRRTTTVQPPSTISSLNFTTPDSIIRENHTSVSYT